MKIAEDLPATKIPSQPKSPENATRSGTRKSAIEDVATGAPAAVVIATAATTTVILDLENENDIVANGILENMARKSADEKTVIPVVTMNPTILPPLTIVEGAKSMNGGNLREIKVVGETKRESTAKRRDEKMKRDGSKWTENER